MSIELSQALERRISDAIAAGKFETPEQLVETAVSRLLDLTQGRRLSLDPPLIPPAGRHLDLTNEQIYELLEH